MGQYCSELGYDQELTDTAQLIADRIHREGHLEGCQPLTIVGVALYMLNNRVGGPYRDSQKFAEYKKLDQEIADCVKKGMATIKAKYEKIKHLEKDLLPDAWLRQDERDLLR